MSAGFSLDAPMYRDSIFYAGTGSGPNNSRKKEGGISISISITSSIILKYYLKYILLLPYILHVLPLSNILNILIVQHILTKFFFALLLATTTSY